MSIGYAVRVTASYPNLANENRRKLGVFDRKLMHYLVMKCCESAIQFEISLSTIPLTSFNIMNNVCISTQEDTFVTGKISYIIDSIVENHILYSINTL